MKFDQFKTSLEIPITYVRSNMEKSRPLVLIFHGFAESAKSALRRVYPEANQNFEVLAMNGPFPVPQYRKGEWKPRGLRSSAECSYGRSSWHRRQSD